MIEEGGFKSKPLCTRPAGALSAGGVMVVIVLLGALLASPFAVNAIFYLHRRKVLRGTCEGNDPLPWNVTAPAFLTECVTMALSFGASIVPLLRHRPLPDSERNHLVILVAGDCVRESSLWVLERRLRLLGWNTATVRGGARRVQPDRAAADLGRRLLRTRNASPAPTVSIVAFGCSGLSVRRWLRDQPAGTIQQFVTLGTPHQGTLGLPSRCTKFRALDPSSRFLRDLAEQDSVPRRFDAIAISSELDAWVVPNDAAYYPGAFNIVVRDVGHFSLLFSKRIAGLIAENLRAVTQRR